MYSQTQNAPGFYSKMGCRGGEFTFQHQPLLEAWPIQRAPSKAAQAEVLYCSAYSRHKHVLNFSWFIRCLCIVCDQSVLKQTLIYRHRRTQGLWYPTDKHCLGVWRLILEHHEVMYSCLYTNFAKVRYLLCGNLTVISVHLTITLLDITHQEFSHRQLTSIWSLFDSL